MGVGRGAGCVVIGSGICLALISISILGSKEIKALETDEKQNGTV